MGQQKKINTKKDIMMNLYIDLFSFRGQNDLNAPKDF